MFELNISEATGRTKILTRLALNTSGGGFVVQNFLLNGSLNDSVWRVMLGRWLLGVRQR